MSALVGIVSVALVHLGVLLAATPTPSPSATGADLSTVSPGLTGFLATFAIVIATVLLILDMSRRVRRLRYRERLAQAAEEAAALSRQQPPPAGQ